jgi:hypothetical protein
VLYTPPPRTISPDWKFTPPPNFWKLLWSTTRSRHAASTFYLILWRALPCAEYFAERNWHTPVTHCVFCKGTSSVSGPTHWFWTATPCTHVTSGPPAINRVVDHISRKTHNCFQYLVTIDNIVSEHNKRYRAITYAKKRAAEHANLAHPASKKPHSLTQPPPTPPTRKRSLSQTN